MGSKNTVDLDTGDKILLVTPGGGGYGYEDEKEEENEKEYKRKNKTYNLGSE